MKILVTGAAGYLGSVLVGRLLDKGHNVRAFDKLLYGSQGLEEYLDRDGYEFQRGDCRHVEDVVASMQGVDCVIHLAGLVGDPVCAMNPAVTVGQNFFSALLVARVAEYYGVRRFIFASSCSVYGKSSSEGLLTSQSPLNPVSMYARDKIWSEKALMEMQSDKFRIACLRMGTLYGLSPRMRFDLVVNTFTARAIIQGEFTVFGGSQWRPFAHVADAADKYLDLAENSEDGIINFATENIQIIELARQVARITGGKFVIPEEIVGDERSYKIDITRGKRTITDGIKEIAEAINTGKIKNPMLPMYSNFAMMLE